MKKINTRMTELTQRRGTGVPLEAEVSEMNRSLRGWVTTSTIEIPLRPWARSGAMRKSGFARTGRNATR